MALSCMVRQFAGSLGWSQFVRMGQAETAPTTKTSPCARPRLLPPCGCQPPASQLLRNPNILSSRVAMYLGVASACE